MALRMVSLKGSKTSGWIARKGIPVDVAPSSKGYMALSRKWPCECLRERPRRKPKHSWPVAGRSRNAD